MSGGDLRHADTVRVIVIGAGIAGSAAALAFGRGGHEVVLVDRGAEPSFEGWSADEVFQRWQPPGIAQFRQPHNFLGLGRVVLRDRFSDVYGALHRSGAAEVDQASFLGGTAREPGDADLAVITCRRPVFDSVLRAAVRRQPRVTYRPAIVSGLRVRPNGPATHVDAAVLATGEVLPGDLFVDASGRGARTAGWLSAAGGPLLPSVTSECGLLYYSRHYRVREQHPMPRPVSLLGGPRGDLGYLAFAVFLGDNRTFCLCIMAAPWDKPFRSLREPAAYQRAAALLPGLAPWLEVAEPISPVLPMGQLRNTLHRVVGATGPLVTGLMPIGDARCHTNPTFAFGASLSLWHAVRLADLADRASDHTDLAMSFDAEIAADATARFDAVSAEDADRARLWSGQPMDVSDAEASMPLFLRFVAYRVAAGDPELLRAVARRIDGLDPVERLPALPHLLDRARTLYAQSVATFPEVPPRTTLLAALTG